MTTKTDVFAFGVVLAELITGQRALIRDNREPNKMKSLITVVSQLYLFGYEIQARLNNMHDIRFHKTNHFLSRLTESSKMKIQ